MVDAGRFLFVFTSVLFRTFSGRNAKNKRKRSYGQIIFISFTVEYAVKCSRMSVFVG